MTMIDIGFLGMTSIFPSVDTFPFNKFFHLRLLAVLAKWLALLDLQSPYQKPYSVHLLDFSFMKQVSIWDSIIPSIKQA